MEIGKLYKTKEFYWMLYRSEDEIVIALSAVTATWARYWSKASFISPKSMFMLLEQDIRHCKILTAEGNIGWICLADWRKCDIVEVKVE